MPRYECDQCGACCAGTLIVEADILDVLREPRLIEADPHWTGKPLLQVLDALDEPGRCVLLAASRPCRFLGPDERCTIYPTRPNDCVALQAGDEQCQSARQERGLLPLLPIPENVG